MKDKYFSRVCQYCHKTFKASGRAQSHGLRGVWNALEGKGLQNVYGGISSAGKGGFKDNPFRDALGGKRNKGKLDGFNLGVSMARKEFLDKINKLKIKLVKQLRGKNVAFTKEEDISLFEQNFKELKQSLEEKHE